MTIGAAIRISSPGATRVIAQAADFAKQRDMPCFVMSVVSSLPYGAITAEEEEIVERNVAAILSAHASPVMQEGSDVAETLLALARGFGIRTLFLQSDSSRRLGRSVAEQLLYLDPPFDVIIVGAP